MGKSKRKQRAAYPPPPPPPPAEPKYPAVIALHNQQLRHLDHAIKVIDEALLDFADASAVRNIVVEKTTEPDNPNRPLLRARVSPTYARLYALRRITRDQKDACEKYLSLMEVAAGGRWINGTGRGAVPAWQRMHAGEKQIRASAQLQSVRQVIGTYARLLLDLMIGQGLPVRDIAARLKTDPTDMIGQIKIILTRMVEHWGLDGRRH